jgi:hypothetical protein
MKKAPTELAPAFEDRRVGGRRVGSRSAGVGRRVAVAPDRRIVGRMRTLKGAQIIWPTAAPIKCIVRNLSETGASLEVHSPVPPTFYIVFDGDLSQRLCGVVWRKETRIGVKFLIAAPESRH